MRSSRSSRHRYRAFVQDYKERRLAGTGDEDRQRPADGAPPKDAASAWRWWRSEKGRAYVREYLRWLRPHRYALAFVFCLALIGAGAQMVNPLFMRFIIDHVLLNEARAREADVTPARHRAWRSWPSWFSPTSCTCCGTTGSGSSTCG